MIVQQVSHLIGHTPLYEFTAETAAIPAGTRLFAKLEYLNPGGSVKDRLGNYLLAEAVANGKLTTENVLVEPTAGNTGIGLALAAVEYGIRTRFIVPEKFSQEKQALMRALGAEIQHTPTELGIQGAIAEAERQAAADPFVYLPAQFSNPDNPAAYGETLGAEIWEELKGEITSFVAGVGSGGTFSGVSHYLQTRQPMIRALGVEPEGSILNGGAPGSHEIEGIGVEFIPPFLAQVHNPHFETISDAEGFYYTRQLAKEHGLLIGSSSGAAFAAALKEAQRLPAGSTIVTIFPDGGDRYLSKNIYGEEVE